ncbi:RelE antibacterial toxin protein [Klebsiella pneumoniae]|uniref:RelE antibacterial toxin protein n=1 Tax=Klebsiella pneumoniae TaxID=573 RepID=A0A2X3IKJ8_KLEPN|nr:RelE antibacterial toxin protein [Klebsiella pneumoniae]
MTYTVKFREDALKEWNKLDKTIQQQFAKKLKKCCENPHIPSAKLRGIKDCYKIKTAEHLVFASSIRSLIINL